MRPTARRRTIQLLLVLSLLPWLISATPAPQTKPPPPAPGEPSYGGKTLPELDTMLQNPDPKERLAAILSLRAAGASAIPIFLWAFDDENADVRIAAIKSLEPLGPRTEAATPALVDLLLNDPIPAVRMQILHTLGEMGLYAAAAVPTLRRLEREGDITTRLNATLAISRIRAAQRP